MPHSSTVQIWLTFSVLSCTNKMDLSCSSDIFFFFLMFVTWKDKSSAVAVEQRGIEPQYQPDPVFICGSVVQDWGRVGWGWLPGTGLNIAVALQVGSVGQSRVGRGRLWWEGWDGVLGCSWTPKGCGHTESDGAARAAERDGPCCKPGWLQSILNVRTHTAGDATCSTGCSVTQTTSWATPCMAHPWTGRPIRLPRRWWCQPSQRGQSTSHFFFTGHDANPQTQRTWCPEAHKDKQERIVFNRFYWRPCTSEVIA